MYVALAGTPAPNQKFGEQEIDDKLGMLFAAHQSHLVLVGELRHYVLETVQFCLSEVVVRNELIAGRYGFRPRAVILAARKMPPFTYGRRLGP